MTMPVSYTLSQLTKRITDRLSADSQLQGVWVVGETVDVRTSGGHCYLELLEKDANGRPLAKVRANIWASTYSRLYYQFLQETGQAFRSDLKVMVCANVTFHPVYGLSLNITGINAAYTLGDAMQRRMQMVEQLKAAGIIDNNRSLPWPALTQRIAVISAPNAAGYGDFMHQLYSNPYMLRFHTRLFCAVMQGERAADTIIEALEAIAPDIDNWDCVVIIRGGGATSELACFDHLRLAEHIANLEIPVVIGIGHERDKTLLDYVAHTRVKTPTAAAELLIAMGQDALARLQTIGNALLQSLTDRLNGCHRQLSMIQGQLPAFANNAVMRANKRLTNAQMQLATLAERRLRPGFSRLDMIAQQIAQASRIAIDRQRQRLDAAAMLIEALSPQATLKRGYTITRIDGHAATNAADIRPGQTIETIFADGKVASQAL